MASCVTNKMVASFSSFSWASVFITCLADFESRFPVGSSARMSAGLWIIALAQAARRRCPPDTSYVRWSRICLICAYQPILPSGLPFLSALPCPMRAARIFSRIVSVSSRLKSWKTKPSSLLRKKPGLDPLTFSAECRWSSSRPESAYQWWPANSGAWFSASRRPHNPDKFSFRHTEIKVAERLVWYRSFIWIVRFWQVRCL